MVKVAGHDVSVALGPYAAKLVQYVSDMVVRLTNGKGPKLAEVLEMDDFLKLVVKRMEFFYVHEAANGDPAKKDMVDFFVPNMKKLLVALVWKCTSRRSWQSGARIQRALLIRC